MTQEERLQKLQSLKKGDKVKLEIVQPDILCDGRKKVSGVFRGIVKTKPSSFSNGTNLGALIFILIKKYQGGINVPLIYDIEQDKPKVKFVTVSYSGVSGNITNTYNVEDLRIKF